MLIKELSLAKTRVRTVPETVTLEEALELLEDYTGQDTATLSLGSYTIARLSAEQIKIATDKNWTLV